MPVEAAVIAAVEAQPQPSYGEAVDLVPGSEKKGRGAEFAMRN